jgi:hypothetical protein
MDNMNEIMNGKHNINVDNLIGRTQKEDRRNKRLMKGIFILYLVCTIFYAALLVINPDNDLTIIDRMTGLCYVLAFSFGTWFFRKEYLFYKKMDYTLPLLQLLELTEKRYRFYNRKLVPVIVIVILVDIGMSLSFMSPDHFVNQSLLVKFLITQGYYWAMIVVSVFIGFLIWRKRSYRIWKDSRTLLKELRN